MVFIIMHAVLSVTKNMVSIINCSQEESSNEKDIFSQFDVPMMIDKIVSTVNDFFQIVVLCFVLPKITLIQKNMDKYWYSEEVLTSNPKDKVVFASILILKLIGFFLVTINTARRVIDHNIPGAFYFMLEGFFRQSADTAANLITALAYLYSNLAGNALLQEVCHVCFVVEHRENIKWTIDLPRDVCTNTDEAKPKFFLISKRKKVRIQDTFQEDETLTIRRATISFQELLKDLEFFYSLTMWPIFLIIMTSSVKIIALAFGAVSLTDDQNSITFFVIWRLVILMLIVLNIPQGLNDKVSLQHLRGMLQSAGTENNISNFARYFFQ